MPKHAVLRITFLIAFNLLIAITLAWFHKPIVLAAGQLVAIPAYAGSVFTSFFGSPDDYGYIDSTGHFVNGLKFQEKRRFVLDSRFSHGMACTSSYNKPSYLTSLGAFVPVPFAKIGRLGENSLAPVFDLDLSAWGFINTAQKLVIPCCYSAVNHFSSGLAAVRELDSKQDGLYGFIDTTGSWKIAPKFEQAGCFSEALAPVKLGGLWGFIRPNGEFKIPPAFHFASEFHNERAVVSKDKLGNVSDNYSCIDSTGRPVFDFTINKSAVPKPFSTYGAIPNSFDPDYKELMANTFDYSEGLLVRQRGNKYGYCDQDGKFVIASAFDFAFPFSNGRAVVYRKNDGGGKYAFIDKNGNLLSDFKFDYATSYSENFACVYIKGRGYLYLDLAGKEAFPDTFELAYPFYEGKALVKKMTAQGLGF